MDENVSSSRVAPRLLLLRRLVFVGGLLAGFFLAGVLLAGTAQAAPGRGDSSGGGSASGTTSAVTHAVAGKATSGKATSAKATSGKATSGKATSGKATSGKATSAKATSSKATSSTATSAVPHLAAPATAAVGAVSSSVSRSPTQVVHHGATTPRPPAPPGAALSRATSAVAGLVPVAAPDSAAHRAPALPIDLTSATSSGLGLDGALAPATVVTTAVAHVAPATSSLLAVLPGTISGTSEVVAGTGATLIDTVTGLTAATTGLTHAVAGSAIGLPPEVLVGVGALAATPGGSGPTVPPTLLGASGTSAGGLPAVASSPAASVLPGEVARDPVPAGITPARMTSVGSPSASWPTPEAAAGLPSQRVLPGGPAPGAPDAPGAPVAPATPAGSADLTSGSGAGVPTGLLTDPLALPAILAALVLIACGRRRAWWFPEVAIGPD